MGTANINIWPLIAQADPNDRNRLKALVAAAGLPSNIEALLNDATDCFRHDIDVWTPSLEFHAPGNKRLLVDFHKEKSFPDFVVFRGNQLLTTTYQPDEWIIRHRLNPPVGLSGSTWRPVVEVFGNPRVWDSVYRACDVGMWYEKIGKREMLFHVEDGSLVDPKAFYPDGLYKLQEKEIQRGAQHVVQAIYDPPSDREIGDFLKKSLGSSNSKGAVLISLDAEKRVWENQVQCLSAFLKSAHKISVVRHVFVNGMTAPARGSFRGFDEQKALEDQLCRQIQKDSGLACSFESLFGLNVMRKIHRFKVCSFFIAPAGSAMVLPSALGIPGVAVGHGEMLDFRKGLSSSKVARVPREMSRKSVLKGLKSYAWASEAEQTSYILDQNAFLGFSLRHYAETVNA